MIADIKDAAMKMAKIKALKDLIMQMRHMEVGDKEGEEDPMSKGAHVVEEDESIEPFMGDMEPEGDRSDEEDMEDEDEQEDGDSAGMRGNFLSGKTKPKMMSGKPKALMISMQMEKKPVMAGKKKK